MSYQDPYLRSWWLFPMPGRLCRCAWAVEPAQRPLLHSPITTKNNGNIFNSQSGSNNTAKRISDLATWPRLSRSWERVARSSRKSRVPLAVRKNRACFCNNEAGPRTNRKQNRNTSTFKRSNISTRLGETSTGSTQAAYWNYGSNAHSILSSLESRFGIWLESKRHFVTPTPESRDLIISSAT